MELDLQSDIYVCITGNNKDKIVAGDFIDLALLLDNAENMVGLKL